MGNLRGWRDVEVQNWSHFTRLAGEATGGAFYRQDMIFRGQAWMQWNLLPSLTRMALNCGHEAARVLDDEQENERYFRANAPLELPHERWALWTVMQHYRTPTRLLDWTLSPYVAAYFAVREDFDIRDAKAQKPGAVWLCHSTILRQRMPSRVPPKDWRQPDEWYAQALESDYYPDEYAVPSDPVRPILWVVAPARYDQRMSAQQGVFTLADHVMVSHDEVIADVCHDTRDFEEPQRWIIAPNLKQEFVRQLHVMNVHAQSLFPGLDGVGDASRERIGLRMAFREPPASFYVNLSRLDYRGS